MKKPLFIGMGTIGKPLIRLALKVKKELGFEEVIFHKDRPERRAMLKRFRNNYGGKLAVYSEKMEEFKKLLEPLGACPDYTFDEA